MSSYLIEIYIFVVGVCIGSFLNVCIYRLPAALSIIRPRSSCPNCHNLIKFYDNIPIFSYLFLFGRCRYCKKPIPVRYLIVETLTGLFALTLYLQYGITLEFIVFSVFLAALIVVIFIDIDHKIIPDIITLPGIILFFIASFFLPNIHYKDALLGILAGGGSLFLVSSLYKFIRKEDGMGGGDIKLLAMIGALIGWKGVIFTIYLSSISGTIVGFIVMLQNRKTDMKLSIPFGPFLSIAAITYIYYGDILIDWYFNLLG